MKRHDVSNPGPDTRYPVHERNVILWLDHGDWVEGWFDEKHGKWQTVHNTAFPIAGVIAWSDPTEPESAEPFAWALTNKLFGGPRPLTAYNNRQLAEDVAAAIDPSLQVVPLYATPPDTAPAWRPIETAPKDGTEIILRKGDRVGAAAWIKWPSTEYEEAGEGWTIGHDSDSWDGDQAPTHWMPLPPPPGESAPTVDHTSAAAWIREWTFDGEERGQDLHATEQECLRWVASDGGVCSPLYKSIPDHTAVMRQAVEALRLAVKQNSHDMMMTGDELRICESAIAALRGALPQPKESQHD